MDPETTAIAPPEPDWNLIQIRYLAGDAHDAIAEEFGVTPNAIRCRAHRHHWKDQLLKQVSRDRKLIGEEIKNSVLVSCLREARALQRTDPCLDPDVIEALSKARERLLSTTARILDWDADPLATMKKAKCLDV